MDETKVTNAMHRIEELYFQTSGVQYDTLRAAKQAFALRQYRKEKNKNGN